MSLRDEALQQGAPDSPEEDDALLERGLRWRKHLRRAGGSPRSRGSWARGALVAAAAAGSAALALRSALEPPSAQRAVREDAAPVSVTNELLQLQQASGTGYFMCTSPGACEPNMLQWNQNPTALAGRVDTSLQSVPGVPGGAWGPFVQEWQAGAPSVSLNQIGAFVYELLSSDPFGTGQGQPYVRFGKPGPTSEPKVVSVTQRQLAFIVANVLMGNDISSGNGLSATIQRCSSKGAKGYLYSLVSLLAVLSKELSGGQQGTTLIGATPRDKDDSWKLKLEDHYMSSPETCVAQGGTQNCADFMAGGTQGQALTDIAGTVVGGGGGLCDLANSQDESLMVFYPEVLAFVFFAGPGDFVPVPWTLLGARRYLNDLNGNSDGNPGPKENKCGWLREQGWINQAMSQNKVQVPLGGQSASVAAGAFVAVASKSSQAVGGCPLQQAVNNNCDSQRHHLDEDLALWYQAYESTMYPEEVQEAFAGTISRIGTGPWGAGVWYGDSQQYFLAVWLGTALLKSVGLDYYIYDHFCENPANQCFVLGSSGCASCVAGSGVQQVSAERCGSASVHDMISKFTGKTAKELYLGLQGVGGPPTQVFDLLQQWSPDPSAMAAPVPGAAEAAAAATAAEPAGSGSSPSPAAASPSPQQAFEAPPTPAAAPPPAAPHRPAQGAAAIAPAPAQEQQALGGQQGYLGPRMDGQSCNAQAPCAPGLTCAAPSVPVAGAPNLCVPVLAPVQMPAPMPAPPPPEQPGRCITVLGKSLCFKLPR